MEFDIFYNYLFTGLDLIEGDIMEVKCLLKKIVNYFINSCHSSGKI